VQAAVLIEKLKIFGDEIAARDQVAKRYSALLKGHVKTPHLIGDIVSAWAQYTILVAGAKRPAIIAGLKERGIPTMVYYPKPLHQQTAYRRFPVAGNGLPVSERLASEVLSLPMHPYLDSEIQDHIVEALLEVMALEGVTA